MVTHHLPQCPDVLCLSEDGKEVRLLGTGVLECECEDCEGVFWIPSNMGTLACPYCAGTRVRKTWTTPRIAFVPQGG
jgi:Zn finger protein HypA/HybF involved in hydrogenase expression